MKALHDLHSAWQDASGQEVNYRATERIFYAAHQMDFTPDDVKIAVKHLIRFNNKNEGAKFRINVFKIIGDLESFAALVAEARAVDKNRRHAPTPKQQIQRAYEQVQDAEQSSLLTVTSTGGRTFKQVLESIAEKDKKP
jgi:hypothetical protein